MNRNANNRGTDWLLWAGALLCLGVSSLLLSQSTAAADAWKAPERAAKKANPLVTASADSIAAGKKTYVKECQSCHGSKGLGDGPGAKDLAKKPRALSSPETGAQTDGELYWKITTGRKPMPTYEKTLTEEQRWQVINYIRTLKEQKKEEKKEEPKKK